MIPRVIVEVRDGIAYIKANAPIDACIVDFDTDGAAEEYSNASYDGHDVHIEFHSYELNTKATNDAWEAYFDAYDLDTKETHSAW